MSISTLLQTLITVPPHSSSPTASPSLNSTAPRTSPVPTIPMPPALGAGGAPPTFNINLMKARRNSPERQDNLRLSLGDMYYSRAFKRWAFKLPPEGRKRATYKKEIDFEDRRGGVEGVKGDRLHIVKAREMASYFEVIEAMKAAAEAGRGSQKPASIETPPAQPRMGGGKRKRDENDADEMDGRAAKKQATDVSELSSATQPTGLDRATGKTSMQKERPRDSKTSPATFPPTTPFRIPGLMLCS